MIYKSTHQKVDLLAGFEVWGKKRVRMQKTDSEKWRQNLILYSIFCFDIISVCSVSVYSA